jgi:hypothetical protein
MKEGVWKIVFEGNLFDGQRPEIVKKRLTSLFNTDLAKVERLFQEGQVIIKSGIDYRTALRFQAAFQKTGAKCRIIQIEKAPSKAEKRDKTETDIPPTSLSTDKVLGAFQGDIGSVEVSRPRKIGLLLVSIGMLLLPLLYIALILMIGYGIYYHATENIYIIAHMGVWERLALLVLAYLAPMVFGTILIVFMIKPIFAPRPIEAKSISLNPYKEEVLFDFVHKISGIVRAPMPRTIEINCDVRASVGFNIGVISLLEEDLVLKFGLPLVAGLNTRQFAGVVARELGHFSHLTGKRLSFIIRSINHWFSQIVLVRDIWDERLEKWSGDAHFGLRAILNIARFFVWITRKSMWVFMKAGHLTSCFLIRHMEFNADRIQARVAGSKQFADTCLRLNTLNIAYEQASADLREARSNKRLVDNLPDLVLSNNNRIPALTKVHLKRHPSDKDRIVNALKENARGIFRLEVPARLLFSGFDNLSREATKHYYRNRIGLTVSDDSMVSVQAFTRYKDDLLHGHGGLEHYFTDTFGVLRPLPIQPRPEIQGKPLKQRIDSLLKTLHLAKKVAPKTLQVLKKYERVSWRALTMLQAKSLQQANLSIDTRSFQLTDDSKEVVERALNMALSEKSAADSLLRKVEALLATRFELALSLLGVPHISKRIDDAEELREESATLLNAYPSFSSAIAPFDELRQAYILLTSLSYNCLDNQDNDTVVEMIQDMKTECKGHLVALYSQLKDAAYPFEHTQVDVSIAEYMMEEDPEYLEQGAVLEICESVIDKMLAFHARLLGRLAIIAKTVEEAVGVKKT